MCITGVSNGKAESNQIFISFLTIPRFLLKTSTHDEFLRR